MNFKFKFLLILLIGCHLMSDAQWQFLKGDTYNPQLPKYGIINQANLFNWPGDRQGAVTWIYNGCLYLFGGTTSYNTYGFASGSGNDIWKYDPATKMWTWIKGSKTVDDTGSVGPIGVENAANLPSARSGVCYWLVGNYVYIYSGDWWKYNLTTNNWTYLGGTLYGGALTYGLQGVPDSNNSPSYRLGASCWSQNNYLYLFGGSAAGELRNDVWRYDLTTHLWTWLKGSNTTSSWYNGVEGTIGVEDAGNTPGVKQNAISVQTGNMVYVYGGYTGGVNNAGDLWRYNIISNNWTKMSGSTSLTLPHPGLMNNFAAANTPGSVTGATMWSKNNSIFLFGGLYSDGGGTLNYYNTTYEFDTTLLKWRWIKGSEIPNTHANYNYKNITVASSNPGARSGGISWEQNDSVYMLGGLGFSAYGSRATIGDLWKYEKNTNNWTWVSGSDNSSGSWVSHQTNVGDVNNRPAPGIYAAKWNIGNDVYVFGRSDFSADPNLNEYASADDIWKYSNSNNSWALVKPLTNEQIAVKPVYGTLNVYDSLNTPGTRRGEASWQYDNKIYIFGGESRYYLGFFGQFADSLMNDVWQFDIVTKEWKWIKGSNICTQNAVYGTQGVAAAGNTPGARTDAMYWVANNKFYLFGGAVASSNGSIKVLNDLWEFDPATNNWRWLKGSQLKNQEGVFGTLGIGAAVNTPSARYGAVTWVENNKLYMFSGFGVEPSSAFGDPEYLHELWAYDITTNNWTWLKGTNSGTFYSTDNIANYGTMGVEGPTVRPGAMIHSTVTYFNNKLYLFGGYGYGGCSNCGGTSNNLWSYNSATNNWTWLSGNGDGDANMSFPDTPVAPAMVVPSEYNNCLGMQSWAFNNRLYIFGGNNYLSNNDIWGYNLCTDPIACNANPPVVFLGNDTTVCAGNYFQLNAGNFGSSYLWSTGDTTQYINVTQSGLYWVHVTNPANLVANDTIMVTFSSMPTVPFAGSVNICAGSSFSINAQNPTCTYLWNTNATSSSINVDTTGNYSVYIANASGCSVSASLKVIQVPTPDAYLGPDTGECSLSPGWPQHPIYPTYVAGDSYLWNTGDTTETIFVTQSGTYSLQITNQYGCVDADTVLITYDTPLVFSLGNDTAICSSIPLILDATHPNCTYIWSDGETNPIRSVNQAGNYMVYITTAFGCQSDADINITLVSEPTANAIQAQINNNVVNFSVTNPQNVTDYKWYFGDNTTASSVTASHTYSQTGSYDVKLVIGNTCSSDTLTKSIQIQPSPTNIIELSGDKEIVVYPNPATDNLAIDSKVAVLENIVLLNVLGQEVYNSGDIHALKHNLNIKRLSSGIYQLNIQTPSGIFSKKIIISR